MMASGEDHEQYPFEADAAKPNLIIFSSEKESSVTFDLNGELDAYTAPEIVKQIGEALETASNLDSVALDLANVRFMDGTGLRIILFTEKILRARAIPFTLKDPSEKVMHLIEIAGYAGHFEVVRTEESKQDHNS